MVTMVRRTQVFFFFSSRRRHTRSLCDWSSDVCSSDLNWNSANDFILYGKGGEFASNKLESQELLMLSLHLLQVSLVYVNTLMIQHVLAEPGWQGRLTAVDLQALSPL